LTPSSVESCKNNGFGYLVSGVINFSSTSPANPTKPESAAQPIPLSVYLSLSPSQFKARDTNKVLVLVPGGEYPVSPSYECFSDAPSSVVSTQTFVNYNCIVYPNNQTPKNWWGQVLLSGLNIGTTASQFRVCRYHADYNGNGYTYKVLDAAEGIFQIDNEEHPNIYRGVTYSLAKQNFLVVRGDVTCPTAPAVDFANGVFVDYSTRQIQPSLTDAE
jgi:hypothetical protein